MNRASHCHKKSIQRRERKAFSRTREGPNARRAPVNGAAGALRRSKAERKLEDQIMADTQVAALDHTIQQTNIWLKTLADELHIEDRHDAYRALRSVLHVLRDRLTPEQAVHLGAQLPLLVRGIFYDGWRIAGKPSDERQPASPTRA